MHACMHTHTHNHAHTHTSLSLPLHMHRASGNMSATDVVTLNISNNLWKFQERENNSVIFPPQKRQTWHYWRPQKLQYLEQLQLLLPLELHLCVRLWCASWCCPWELLDGGTRGTGMASLQCVCERGASGPDDWWSASGRGCTGVNPHQQMILWYRPFHLLLHCHTYSQTCHAYNCLAHPRTCNRVLWAHHQSIHMLQVSASIIHIVMYQV